MHKLLLSGRDSDDLSFGFDRDCNKRRDEFRRNKNIKGEYYQRIMLKDVFRFAERQRKSYFRTWLLTQTNKK